MNPLDLIGKALKTVGSITGIGVLKSAGDFLDGPEGKQVIANLPPEQAAAVQQAILQHEKDMRALDIEELKTVVSESMAMIQSNDKYTSRARPTGVYAATGITAAIAIAMIFGVKIDATAILTMLAPLWGNSIWYTTQRSQEKKTHTA